MEMPGRTFNPDKYKFGFNGKLNDNEVYGVTGSFQDYGMRMYDTRVCRFISVDPLTKKYPMLTPYQFASNSPIRMIDLDGKEGVVPVPSTAPDAVISNLPANGNYEVSTKFKYSPTSNTPLTPSTEVETKAEIKDPESNPLSSIARNMGRLSSAYLDYKAKITSTSTSRPTIEESYDLKFSTQEGQDLYDKYNAIYENKKQTALANIPKPALLPADATDKNRGKLMKLHGKHIICKHP